MFHCHLAFFTKIKHVLSYFFRSMSESSVVVSESDFISRPTVSGPQPVILFPLQPSCRSRKGTGFEEVEVR